MKNTNEKSPTKGKVSPVSKTAKAAGKTHYVSLNTGLQDDSASNASYSEAHEVTPPVAHPVPSIGNTKSDFENAGRHGRTSSRMIDHEPGL